MVLTLLFMWVIMKTNLIHFKNRKEMRNAEIEKLLKDQDGFLLNFYSEEIQDKKISKKKIEIFIRYVLEISTGFANGVVPFTENTLQVAKKNNEILEENIESAQMWLRLMYSARDDQDSPGKKNYSLLQKTALKFLENETALFQIQKKDFDFFEKEVRSLFRNIDSAAVLFVIIEYIMPDILAILSQCLIFLDQDEIKYLQQYMHNHKCADTHAGYHAFRALIPEDEQKKILKKEVPKIMELLKHKFEVVKKVK